MTYEKNIHLIENKKPIELVQEIENYQIKKSPLSPAARGKVISKSGSNFVSEKEGYGPMPFYRDHTPLVVDFSSKMNGWLFRALFQYEDGTIKSKLCITGIDEMKKTLRKLENGEIKVVRNKQYSSLEYELCKPREEQLKRKLREKIESLENDYRYYEENTQFMIEKVDDIWQN